MLSICVFNFVSLNFCFSKIFKSLILEASIISILPFESLFMFSLMFFAFNFLKLILLKIKPIGLKVISGFSISANFILLFSLYILIYFAFVFILNLKSKVVFGLMSSILSPKISLKFFSMSEYEKTFFMVIRQAKITTKIIAPNAIIFFIDCIMLFFIIFFFFILFFIFFF